MEAKLQEFDLSKVVIEEILQETPEEQKVILKQLEFIKFLQGKGLYNYNESTVAMRKMQRVWEACGSPT